MGDTPKYKTVKELQKKIDDYFKKGVTLHKEIVGSGITKRVIEIPIPTITGLCLYLGFCDRVSFYDYEKKPEFAYTIKTARTRIEKEYEEQLWRGNPGAIFALKNFGWKDTPLLTIQKRTVIFERHDSSKKEVAEESGRLHIQSKEVSSDSGNMGLRKEFSRDTLGK